MTSKHRYWVDQLDGIAHELSKLAIACDIDLQQPDVAVKILNNDASVCRRQNPQAFAKIRHHLMALFPLEERAIKRLGADETQEILDDIRAAIAKLRAQGRPG